MTPIEFSVLQIDSSSGAFPGLASIILTGVIAFSTLMSWIAVLQANGREKRRIEREENPKLHLIGSAVVKVSNSSSCSVDLFVNNPGKLSANLLDVKIKSPQAYPVPTSGELTWLWNIVFPLVDTELLERGKPLPGPILAGGVTKVRCGCDFRLGSVEQTVEELDGSQLRVRLKTVIAGYEPMEYDRQVHVTAKRT